MAIDSTTEAQGRPVAKGLRFTAEESERFMRIFTESLPITRHYQLFLWLQGELQHILPHKILVSAWGDFPNWRLKLDIISGLAGVRTRQLAHCHIDGFLKPLYAGWVSGGRRPLVVRAAHASASIGACPCPMHSALRGLDSILVHGVRDERGGHESLYVALNSGSFTKGRSQDRFVSLIDSLIAQIDVAFRKVAALPLEDAKRSQVLGDDGLELSSREQEILGCVCQGKTNVDIAAVLDISPFTVKNHVQRIFRKIGVSNRTEAAAKYNEALRELRGSLDR
jgi:transcriptional regulator EpsA